ncbi:MAG: MFS transporter [Chlamydiia bacterium]|nr:MFS transporter [Chlamydiia bacterium]
MTFLDRLDWHHPTLMRSDAAFRPWLILITIVLVNICAAQSGFSMILTDSSIQGSLAVGDFKNMWLSLCYFLFLAVTVPIANWLAQAKGYKKIFLIGSALFFIFSYFCGLTTNYWWMFFYRVVSAVGGGMIFPTSLTLITGAFPKKRVTLAVAIYVAATFGLGYFLGVMSGGYFGEFYTWKFTFTVVMILAPFTLIPIVFFIDETERQDTGPFDLLGTVLYLLFVGSIVAWLGNVKAPWITEGFRSAFSLISLSLFVCSGIGFILWENRCRFPLFKLSLFKVRPFVLSNLALFAVGSTFFSTTSMLTLIFEENLYYSKYASAILQLPLGVCVGIFGAISGLLSQKVGIRPLALLGMALTGISCFTTHSITIQSDHIQYFWVQVIRGTGIGLSLGPLTALALKRIMKEDIGQAAVIVTLFRQLGGAVGTIFIEFIEQMRFPFHFARFGEQIVANSPAFLKTMQEKGNFFVENGGAIPNAAPYPPLGGMEESSSLSFAGLVNNVATQAKILAINDAYYLIGWFVLILLVIIAFFMTRAYLITHFKKKRRI